MNNLSWIEEALDITIGQRQAEYGSPLKNFLRTSLLWSLYLITRPSGAGAPITPEDVAWMMNLLKIARQVENFKRDNGVDALGYISCIDQMNQHLEKLGYVDGIKIFRTMSISDMTELLQKLS